MKDVRGKLVATGETADFEADMIFKAIGQTGFGVLPSIALKGDRIIVDAERRTIDAKASGPAAIASQAART